MTAQFVRNVQLDVKDVFQKQFAKNVLLDTQQLQVQYLDQASGVLHAKADALHVEKIPVNVLLVLTTSSYKDGNASKNSDSP